MKIKRIKCAQCGSFFEDEEKNEPQFCKKSCEERYQIAHASTDKNGFFHDITPEDYILINCIASMRILVYSRGISVPFLVDVEDFEYGGVTYSAYGQQDYFGIKNPDYFKEWPMHWIWKLIETPEGF